MTISVTQFVSGFLTIGARLTGVMLFAPFFGSAVIPPKLPRLLLSQWPMTALSELLIGIALGIATNIVFDGVQMAGQVLSVQMGYSLVNILDPQTLVESTVVATFHQTIAMLVFLRLNVHLWILHALANSFAYLPPASGHMGAAFASYALRAGASAFTIGVQLAAPVLAATLFADIALGLLGKASPQLPILLMGPPVKSVLGIVVLISALRYWPDLFESMFLNSIATADHLLHLAQ